VKKVVFTLIATLLGLGIIEGASRLVVFAIDSRSELTERKHTKYDAELGWVNVPSIAVADLYGPGRSLTINSQGFRARRDYRREVPIGKTRVLCSGDSFTLGWGVDDDDTWCALLEKRNATFEAVNMGQGGYGIDQAYLWWRRDGNRLEYDLHVFAIIYDDLHRMRLDRFQGYGKPTLQLEDGVPVAAGVPVPKRRLPASWRSQVGTAELVARLVGRRTAVPADEPKLAALEVGELAIRALEVMHEENARRGSRLVVVWLPTLDEDRPGELDRLRGQVMERVGAAGIDAIDLVEDFRRVPPDRVDSLFLVEPGAGGRHYSEAGHRFVAARLAARLADIREGRA
jgi:hypothetical protein